MPDHRPAASRPAELRPVGPVDGAPAFEGRLESAEARIAVLSWGAALIDWRARIGDAWRPVTPTLADPADFPAHSADFGVLAGRVANRIGGARFTLGGRAHRLEANLGPHMLHGGARGWARRPWDMRAEGDALVLTLDDPAGSAGFPGRVRAEARLTLDGPRLILDLTAEADADTPANVAWHPYWNLDGPASSDIRGHRLRLDAAAWAETDAELIPSGRLRPAGDGAPDFRDPRPLAGPDGAPLDLDHAYALAAGRDPDDPVAELLSSRGDLRLTLRTDRPSVQVYTAAGLNAAAPGRHGFALGPFAGVCLEAQDFPDAPNRPEFPSVIVGPGRPYRQRTSVEIAAT